MQKDKIINRIIVCLKKDIPNLPEDIKINLIDKHYLDSLSLISVLVSLEEEFLINFTPDEFTANNFSSIVNISVIIKKHLNKENQ